MKNTVESTWEIGHGLHVTQQCCVTVRVLQCDSCAVTVEWTTCYEMNDMDYML